MSFNTGISDVLGVDTDSFQKIKASAESLHSVESFNKSLRNVLDLFIRTGNVLKNTVTRFNKSLKQGEIEKYTNDHTLIVKSIEKLSFFDAKDTKVDIPYGMQGTYTNAISTLSSILEDLDAPTIVNLAYDSFKHIRSEALAGDNISARVADLNTTLSVKKNFLTEAGKKLNAVFTSKHRNDVKFSNVFSSMDDFRNAKIACIEAEKFLQQANDLACKGSDLAAIVQDVTAVRDVEVDKKLSDSLADSAMTLAGILDLYGTACLNLMSVSHNFTLVFNSLYKKVK